MVHREAKGQTKAMMFHEAMLLRYFSGRNEDMFAFFFPLVNLHLDRGEMVVNFYHFCFLGKT